MTNPKNLKMPTHEQAVTLGRKGGLVKSAKKQWTNLKYCSQKCPYSSTCPFMTASMASPNSLCALKEKKITTGGKQAPISQELINTFFSLFEDGEEGLLREGLVSLYKVKLKNVNASSDDLHDYIKSIIDLKKAFYGVKIEQPITNININTKTYEFITAIKAEQEMEANRKEAQRLKLIETTAKAVD